ncbi:proline--tRNA ligase [Enterococcus timonensis]|uniref:proline--tRNA ligase n=1 Tax=Enterococcus timonensis TaxID=1852364 RepID=UPI0008D8E548|nr:proline--tRNA ligase [Enterococcus timonensis]
MRQSELFIPTLRQTPKDITTDAHQLLIQSGFIRQVAAGVYAYLPLAFLVLEKIKKIIRENFSKEQAGEVDFPYLMPADILEKSGQLDTLSPELFMINDRAQRQFVLSPSAEALFASVVFGEGLSYKRFPLTLFHVQTKFRDDQKVRHGLFQAREFLVAAAYSFQATSESLQTVFNHFEGSFNHIFQSCGITALSVLSENSILKGGLAKQFVALTDIGSVEIARSSVGDYLVNRQLATNYFSEKITHVKEEELQVVTTSELPKELTPIVAWPYQIDDQKVLILLPAHRTLNESKLKNFFLGQTVSKIPAENLPCPQAFLGPIDQTDFVIYADRTIAQQTNGIYGANQEDRYYLHGNAPRDFMMQAVADFLLVEDGDTAPDGVGQIEILRGIDIADLLKLDDFYAQTLNGFYTDENAEKQPILMNCFEIGISKMLQVIAQQHHDEKGLLWPKAVAPFDVHILLVNLAEKVQGELLTFVEEQLTGSDYSYLVDDRPEHIGVKFADSELIGCPIRIVIGKKASEGILEITLRQSGEKVEVKKEDLMEILPILSASQF